MDKGFKDMMGPMEAEGEGMDLPSIHLDVDQVKNLDKWELGKSYIFTATMVSKTERIGDRPTCAEFDIMEVKPAKGGKAEKPKGVSEDSSTDTSYDGSSDGE